MLSNTVSNSKLTATNGIAANGAAVAAQPVNEENYDDNLLFNIDYNNERNVNFNKNKNGRPLQNGNQNNFNQNKSSAKINQSAANKNPGQNNGNPSGNNASRFGVNSSQNQITNKNQFGSGNVNANKQALNVSLNKNSKNSNSHFSSNYKKESLSLNEDSLPNVKVNPSSNGQNIDRLYLPPKGYLPPSNYLPPGTLELPK